MRRNVNRILFFLVFFNSIFLVHGQAKTIEPFIIPSVRFSALGGNHAAVGDSFYSIFTNPASFVDISGQFSAAELSVTTYGPVFELADLFLSNTGSASSMDFTPILGTGKFSAGFDIAGPLSLGWVGKGLGLGIFSRFKTDAPVSGINLRPAVSGDLLLTAGYSFRIINKNSHLLDGGFLGKGFFRGQINLVTPMWEVPAIIDDPFSYDPFSKPFVTYLGLGLDLGLRYTWANTFAFSVVCFDVYSPVLVTPYNSIFDFGNHASPSADVSYTSVRRRLDAGLKYCISNTFIDRYFTSLTVMADYHDLLDLLNYVPRNPILNAGIGVEMTVLNALSFRFGLADALPAFGVGLNLSFMTLDLSIFGKELGLVPEPGKNSTYCLGVGLLFRY
ncbi:MAG: hypothetical protein FWD78_08825 [Treponema sp.]|nr:hypothetical protein [Treponema sp.]